MYKKEFDTYLAKSTPKALLLHGESEFFIDFYTKAVLKKLPDATITTFYFKDYELKSALDILSSGSLFGGQNGVVLKLDSKLPKKDLDLLLGAIASTPNFLIINFYRAESKTPTQYAREARDMAKHFKTPEAIEVRFFAPTPSDGIAILSTRARELGITIAPPLLQTLLQIQNSDIAIALKELEKYQLLAQESSQEITHELIKQISYGLGSITMEDFLNVFFEQREFLPVYAKMQEEGINPDDILRELERYFYILFLFCAYAKAHGEPNPSEILGYAPPKFITDTYIRRAIKIKLPQYQKIFEILRHWRIHAFRGESAIDISSLIKIKAFL